MRRREKFIFIDRDGVINKDPGGWTPHSYVTRKEEFKFLPGALEALKLLRRNGYKVIVVSNQAGVSKGYFTRKHLDEVNRVMLAEVSSAGGLITESFYCVHRDEDNCSCRKPKTGLLESAVKKYGINPSKTYIIGDSKVDVIAGRDMGARTIFVLSGKTPLEETRKWAVKPDYVFADILSAVKWILEKTKRKDKRAFRRKNERDVGI